MKAKILVTAFLALTALLPCPVQADWDTGMTFKMHYPQMPDENGYTGMDIMCTDPYALADDFYCTCTSPITDIHIWGSWLDDILPLRPGGTVYDPTSVAFTLVIYSDIPAMPPEIPYSRPGQILWRKQFNPGTFKARRWSVIPQPLPPERFFVPDPNGGQVVGHDNTIWQYNFYIPYDPAAPGGPFVQREGTIYWLGVQALPIDALQRAKFGWKTSISQHFNDDAVWSMPLTGAPLPLVYPKGHPWEGKSIDLSFVITGRLPGDFNGDGSVDVIDLLTLVDAFGSVMGDSNYDPACDVNADGSIDVIDLLTMVDYFGKTGPC